VQASECFNFDSFITECLLFQKTRITAVSSILQSEGFPVLPAVLRSPASTCIAQPWGSSCLTLLCLRTGIAPENEYKMHTGASEGRAGQQLVYGMRRYTRNSFSVTAVSIRNESYLILNPH